METCGHVLLGSRDLRIKVCDEDWMRKPEVPRMNIVRYIHTTY